MRAIRHIIDGCRDLEHCGPHPGTAVLVCFVAMGSVAGAGRGGWPGALAGGLAMAALVLPMYLSGARYRGAAEERIRRREAERANEKEGSTDGQG